MKVSLLLIAVAAILIAQANAQANGRACAADRYTIVPLPLRPVRISSSGVIAGMTEDHRPATWTRENGLREIELPSGFISAEVTGINRSGEIAGWASRTGSDRPLAFRTSRDKFLLLSEKAAKAAALNDSGSIAGESENRLALWRERRMQPLGDCCGGIVHAVNDRGQVVGQANDANGHYRAFLWDAAQGLRSIGPPDAAMSTALAVNEAGHILIETFTPNAVYLREEGKLVRVDLAPDVPSQPLALNHCDLIVGEFGAASDFYHAFIWDRAHGFRDLNRLIEVGSGWNFESAVDINDRGEIIGLGDHENEEDAGFLLVPGEKSAAKTTRRSSPK
jgi:probable HAF family extracellular repeat protein